MRDRRYRLALAGTRRRWPYHLVPANRRRMLLCRAERNVYVNVQPLDWGERTIPEWQATDHTICANCLRAAGKEGSDA